MSTDPMATLSKAGLVSQMRELDDVAARRSRALLEKIEAELAAERAR